MKVSTKKRMGPNQYNLVERILYGKYSFQTPTYEDSFWNFLGYPSDSQLEARERIIEKQWEKEYVYGLCKNDEVLPLANMAHWPSDMAKIIEQGSYSNLLSYIDIKNCGEEFGEADGPLDTALNVGLSCLQGLGGEGPGLAAKMIGIIIKASDLGESGKKLTFDCSPSKVQQFLMDDGKKTANGIATNQCEENWPEITMDTDPNHRGGDFNQMTRTTFHEMFHLLGFYHGQGMDRTNWCTFACFGQGFGSWKGNLQSQGPEQDEYSEKAKTYCNGENSQMGAAQSIDFEIMMENSESSKNVALLNSLYAPTKEYANYVTKNFMSSADQGIGTAWILAYGYGDDSYKLKQISEFISKESGILSETDLRAFRWATIADKNQREESYDQAAKIFESIYQKVLKVKTEKLSENSKEIYSDLIPGFQAGWRGFCQRNKDKIKAKEYWLEDLEFDPIFSGY